MKKTNSLFSRLTNTKQKKIEENPIERAIKKKASASSPSSIISGTLSDAGIEEMKSYNDFDTEEILRGIDEFDRIDLETVEREDLKQLLMKIIPYNFVTSIVLREGAELFRARSWVMVDGDRSPVYETFDDIWYPKPKYLKKLGRFNDVGQPILYVSMDAMTPIFEIRNSVDEQFAMIRYKLKPGQVLNLTTIATELDKFTEIGLQRLYNWTEKGLKNWRIINGFIASLFKKKIPLGEEYKYKATVELLNILDFSECDGYIYPSVERGNGGYNIAIKPASADRALDFDGIAYVFNDNYRGDRNRVNDGDFSIWQRWAKEISGGRIIYEPIGPCKLNFPGMGGGRVMPNKTTYRDPRSWF